MEEKKNKKWDKTELKILYDAISSYGRKNGISKTSRIIGRTESACTNKYYSYEFREYSNKMEIARKQAVMEECRQQSKKEGWLWRILKRIFG